MNEEPQYCWVCHRQIPIVKDSIHCSDRCKGEFYGNFSNCIRKFRRTFSNPISQAWELGIINQRHSKKLTPY